MARGVARPSHRPRRRGRRLFRRLGRRLGLPPPPPARPTAAAAPNCAGAAGGAGASAAGAAAAPTAAARRRTLGVGGVGRRLAAAVAAWLGAERVAIGRRAERRGVGLRDEDVEPAEREVGAARKLEDVPLPDARMQRAPQVGAARLDQRVRGVPAAVAPPPLVVHGERRQHKEQCVCHQLELAPARELVEFVAQRRVLGLGHQAAHLEGERRQLPRLSGRVGAAEVEPRDVLLRARAVSVHREDRVERLE